jgi:hypothetical protein
MKKIALFIVSKIKKTFVKKVHYKGITDPLYEIDTNDHFSIGYWGNIPVVWKDPDDITIQHDRDRFSAKYQRYEVIDNEWEKIKG